MVCLENHSNADYYVTKGQRFAQLVLEKIGTPQVVEVAELTPTVRGDNGFGSTGLSAPCQVDLCGQRGGGKLTIDDRRNLAENGARPSSLTLLVDLEQSPTSRSSPSSSSGPSTGTPSGRT